jgi:hypothetical protein
MQDRDELERLMGTKLGTFDDLAKEPMPAKAVQRTIAELPNKGDVVKLRGLDFVVRYVNKKMGKLHLEIRVEQRDGADTGDIRDGDEVQRLKAQLDAFLAKQDTQ